MPLFAKTRSFLRSLLSRRRVDDELDRELHAHLDLLTDENLRAGMGRPEAERAARLELGGMEQVKEQVRDRRLGNWLQSVLGDVRYALRQLRKNPGFTAVAILTLALGIGANTAIFSVVDGVLLRSLPYRDPGRLVMVWERNSEAGNPYNTVSPPNFLDWQARNSVFSGMAYVCDIRNNLTGQGDPEEVVVQAVSANFFIAPPPLRDPSPTRHPSARARARPRATRATTRCTATRDGRTARQGRSSASAWQA